MNPYNLPDAGHPDNIALYLEITEPHTQSFALWLQAYVWHILVLPGQQYSCGLKVTFNRPIGPVANYAVLRVIAGYYRPFGIATGRSYQNSFNTIPNLGEMERIVMVTTEGDPAATGRRLCHELGHSCGLSHTDDQYDLMNQFDFPNYYNLTVPKRQQIHNCFNNWKSMRINV